MNFIALATWPLSYTGFQWIPWMWKEREGGYAASAQIFLSGHSHWMSLLWHTEMGFFPIDHHYKSEACTVETLNTAGNKILFIFFFFFFFFFRTLADTQVGVQI